jgi:hypothetical protein
MMMMMMMMMMTSASASGGDGGVAGSLSQVQRPTGSSTATPNSAALTVAIGSWRS